MSETAMCCVCSRPEPEYEIHAKLSDPLMVASEKLPGLRYPLFLEDDFVYLKLCKACQMTYTRNELNLKVEYAIEELLIG